MKLFEQVSSAIIAFGLGFVTGAVVVLVMFRFILMVFGS